MAIKKDSRLTLVAAIQPVDAFSRQPVAPRFVDLRQRVQQDSTDAFVTVGATNWPLLAREAYEDGSRWWALADVSSVVDPFAELPSGTTVRVPTVERLLFDVLRF